MPSIGYEEIRSRFLSKIETYSFLKESEDFNNEFIQEWLLSTLAQPHVRNVFDSIDVNFYNYMITFELQNPIDDLSDKLYATELLAIGIVTRWIEPKVKSELNLQQMYGGKEEKWYSEANHLNAILGLYKESQPELKKLIADRNSLNNSYLNGGS